MTVRLPVGVVGVGALGRHHARHLAMLDEARLVGVFDTDLDRARAVAGEVGTAACVDLDSLLDLVEGVTVAVPTPAHAAVGLRALERGVPVLMEKPLAATVDEADALIAAASRGGLQLQVGHIERYNRALRAAEPYLAGPRYIESLRLAPFQPRGTDVAVVLDLMIHDLDLVLHLTGGAEATEVRASGLSLLSSHLDLANARVEFANGAVALATASRVSRERIRQLRLFQPNGYLSLDLASGAGEFMRVRGDWRPGTGQALSDVVERIELVAPEADALQLELRSFVHAVRGQREVVVSGEEGRAALALALRVTDAVGQSPLAVPAAG
ncbi:MAG: Gfo/Idh/MocA family oxidoreductase [Gemmatimonadales bacterium]|nr:Gfo/Idh/MocA family oxidoreductase [Gemmatimonadales bacterium]